MSSSDARLGIPWPGKSLLGALPAMQKDPVGMVARAAFEVGPVVHLRLPHIVAQVASVPHIAEVVLHAEARRFTKQTRGYEQLRKVLGNGLLTSEGDFWLRQRRLAQPAFHRERLASFAARMVKAAQDVAASWEEKAKAHAPLDVVAEYSRLTLRIVSETLLTADVTAHADEVGRALGVGLEAIGHRLTHPLQPEWLPTKKNRELKRAAKVLDEVVLGLIARRRAGDGPDDDLLAMLLHAVDEETGARMDDQQLRDEVMTIFLAGHETTAMLLSWTSMLLSKSPDVERWVLEELTDVLAGRAPTVADLPRLKRLTCVIKEALRLYPPAWILVRRVAEETVIDGWLFPKQSIVVLPPYTLHRLPDVWPNPEGFDPRRFEDAEPGPLSAPKGTPKGAYLPFSLGARKCIGDTFALMEAQLVLATVLPRVSLSLVPGAQVGREGLITLRPKGLFMHARPRATTGAPARVAASPERASA
ncbi:MAG: cytochrome P450 [Myxococcota bacterium]